MAHETCPDCGCRVYNLGCVNCDEPCYIEEQERLDEHYGEEDRQTSKHSEPAAGTEGR